MLAIMVMMINAAATATVATASTASKAARWGWWGVRKVACIIFPRLLEKPLQVYHRRVRRTQTATVRALLRICRCSNRNA